MKKTLMFVVILAFLCAGVMLFAEGEKEDAAKGEIVITIPHYKAGQNVGGKFFLPQVERFNEKYAGTYKLVIEEIPQDSYMNKIKQLAQQDKLPALIEGADKEWFKDVIINNGLFFDMSDWFNGNKAIKNLAIKASLDYVTTAKGEIVSVPFAVVRPIGMYYNSTMVNFSKPVTEMTIDEFKKSLGDQKIAMMTAENAWTTSLFFTAIVVEEGGADVIRTGINDHVVDYTTDMWLRSFAKLQIFLQNYASANTLGAAYADAANSFMSKNAAVIANGPWMVGDFASGSSDKWSNGFTGDQVKAAMYPGNMAIANLEGYHWWMPNNIPEGEKEAALAFLEFVYSPEELEAFMIAEGGTAPNLNTSAYFREKLAENRILSELDQAVNADTIFIPVIVDVMPHSVGQEDWGRLLPKLIDGTFTPLQFGEELSRKAVNAKE